MRTGTLPDYRLSCPGERDALAALGRVLGDQRASDTWSTACRSVGVVPGALALEDVAAVGTHLAAQSGVNKLIGASILIRLRTYELLAARTPVAA